MNNEEMNRLAQNIVRDAPHVLGVLDKATKRAQRENRLELAWILSGLISALIVAYLYC